MIGREKGFTLIELLIVVSIIAMLIAISVPMISSNKARVFVNENLQVGKYLEGDIWKKHLELSRTNSKYSHYLKERRLTVDKNGYVGLIGDEVSSLESKLDETSVMVSILEAQIFLLESRKEDLNLESGYNKYGKIAEIDKYIEEHRKALTAIRYSLDNN